MKPFEYYEGCEPSGHRFLLFADILSGKAFCANCGATLEDGTITNARYQMRLHDGGDDAKVS